MTYYHNLTREFKNIRLNNTLTDAQVDNVKAVYHTEKEIYGGGV